MIDLIYAHPYPERSRANRALLSAVAELPGVNVRSLYDLYPDFSIDVDAEQQALLQAHTVIWQHPLYWYSVPPLMKLWFDKVLAYGWAYGDNARALQGKRCLWVATSGGDEQAFSQSGMHGYEFSSFIPPILQTAKFCGMQWETPLLVHGARRVTDAQLKAHAQDYRDRLIALQARVSDGSMLDAQAGTS